MENLPITIIVKAPNQQIEDQTIKCERTWSINKLKQHLSEVYPSKPAKDEQKLIYSGQLLGDSDILKDVLRQYEGQDTHTVHLVCTPKFAKEQKQRRGPAEAGAAAASNAPRPSGTPAARPPVVAPTSRQNETPQSGAAATAAGGAARGAPAAPGHRMPNVQWTAGPAAGPMDPAQYAMHLAWMQQAYIQYMNQYMQLAANSYPGLNVPTADGPLVRHRAAASGGANAAAPPAQGNAAGAAPPQEPAAAPAQPPAAAPAHRDPDNPERDWLDFFYILSRVLVLFSVVYFYSSPLRLFFVLLLGVALYFYHVGFFRLAHHNNNNNTVPPAAAAAAAAASADQQEAPSRLNVVWTFFTAFFASLIPEIPNPV